MLIPAMLFCQKKSGELLFSIVDSTIIDAYPGDMIIELVDGKESVLLVDSNDIGRAKEWNRDTVKYLFTQKEIISFSLEKVRSSSVEKFFRYFNFQKMESYNCSLQENGFDKVAVFKMFEDFHSNGTISEFKIDKKKSKKIAGVNGFWIEYFVTDEKKTEKVQGYISESINFPLPLLPPKEKRLEYVPLSLSIEQVRQGVFWRKTVFKMLSYKKVKKRDMKKRIGNFKRKINDLK